MSCDTRVENHDSGSVGSGERGYEVGGEKVIIVMAVQVIRF